MSRWVRRPADLALALLTVPGMAAAQAPPPAPASAPVGAAQELQRSLERLAAEQAAAQPPRFGETLLLGLQLNGIAQPQTVRAVRVPEGLAIPQALWEELKLRPPTRPPRLIEGEPHMILGDGPGELLRWRIEDLSQTLQVEAPPQAFTDQRLDVARAMTKVTLPSTFGLYGNYDVNWQRRLGDAGSIDGLMELGVLTPGGDLNHQQLYRSTGGWVRLDTRWTLDRPEHMASLRLGDSIAQPGNWGRAMRFGGVQWSTDFSLRPGFLSFPLPTLRGEASLPSTVDVFVNNSQRLQGRVQAGPFDISDLPLVTGQGEIRTVVRDLLGREQVVVQPYYISPSLLKPGLSAHSVELGWLRQDYGVASNRYGRAAAMGTWRQGVGERFTQEWRGEWARRQQAVGASGLWLVPALGTLNLSGVLSRSDDPAARRGALVSLGLERQGMDWSGGLQARRATRGFTQLGQAVQPAWSLSGSVGTTWKQWGLGLGVVQQGRLQRPVVDGLPSSGLPSTAQPSNAQPSGGSTLWSFNASRSLDRWGFIGLSALRVSGGGTALSVFWSLLVDDHQSVSTAWQAQRGAGATQDQWQVQFQSNPPIGEGVGYQLLHESAGRRQAQAQWQNNVVALNGGIARVAGQTDVRVGASGGLAWMDGSAYASRRIDGGFAVVQVSDQAGVRVTHDHQTVGRTDGRGRAFLPSLRGYQVNRVGVIADDLPMDAEIEALELQVTPAARSAALIRFPIRHTRTATFRLVDETGEALPPGTELRVLEASRTFPVGLDGKAFVTGLSPPTGAAQRAQARFGDHVCWVEIRLPPDVQELPDLGTLVCSMRTDATGRPAPDGGPPRPPPPPLSPDSPALPVPPVAQPSPRQESP